VGVADFVGTLLVVIHIDSISIDSMSE